MQQIKQWRRLSGALVATTIDEEVERVLITEKATGNRITICIGTDSQVKNRTTEFATVIVFVRKANGAFMYLHKTASQQRMTIKERMLLEVAKSIEVAVELQATIARYDVEMEVHADINNNPAFKSNEALDEARGYITGMGFVFKSKPASFASSSCANKIVQ